MNKEKILIDISPAGGVSIDAQGFKGKSCTKATEQIELVLGGGMAKSKKKPEYFAPPASTRQGAKLTF